MAFNLSRVIRLKKNPIDKAPKLFAARIGFLFSIAISVLVYFEFAIASELLAGTLFLFAFLECGVNFCAGCWVYTYVVVPFVKDR